MSKSFAQRVIDIIKAIPHGRVATYGQIASYAGNNRASRQVAYILHACSEKEDLPWHRVINRQGFISLKPRQGFEIQRQLLEKEQIIFDKDGRISLKRYQWLP